MLRVKICGITNLEDALYAISCGADALGFVFYEKSPRYISPSDAKAIIDKLPPFVERVGLFVNEEASYIEEVSKSSHISIAQIHFDVDEEFLDSIDFKTLPVIRAKCKEDIEKFPNRYKLVDAYCQEYGGSGKRLNIEWFENRDNSHIILAGGLDASNVGSLQEYGFYGVDVSSGVEASKGKKDFEKVKQFIDNAKAI
jgi:phosphoribosylanthranilate isomerase